MRNIINLSLLASMIRLATPLILAALGGLYSERSGVINIALEGIMLAGAFTAAAVTVFTHNPWIGMLTAMIAGLLVAGIHAVASIQFRANQVVVGTAINILFIGVPALVSGALFESTGSTPQLPREQTLPDWNIPGIDRIPVLSQLLSGHKPIVYIALLAVPITYYVLFRTRFGLRLRAVGENPEAADTAGVSVAGMRYAGVLLSGVLAGLGGAYLSIGQNSLFTRNMTAGRGFIALAALIFGKWHPVGAFLACLLFGLADAVAIRMQGVVNIPVQFIQIIPYVLTLVVLAGFIGRAIPPRAIGEPYVKETR
ncbi:MAG TPA: ABC transporter permease [Blastocatellia bacterium]|jgi:general nucleoside transport system permease protein|nr:ABC transporter permease [Blastocatellia bacterium]